jgi:bacillithiol biosynthesis deacetylase BshB2
MGKPFFANRETLPKLREKELLDACNDIGVENVHLWKMQDKTLQFRDPEFLADKIYEVIEATHPSIVYSYYPEHGVHPDHDALSAATVLAISRLPEDQRPVFYGSAITRERYDVLGQPDVEVDVTDVLEKKMNALRSHRSQSELITKKIDGKLQENPDKAEEILSPYTKEYYWIYQFSDQKTNAS